MTTATPLVASHLPLPLLRRGKDGPDRLFAQTAPFHLERRVRANCVVYHRIGLH